MPYPALAVRPFAALLLTALAAGCSGSRDDPAPTSTIATGGFFDDFSVDALRYTADRRPDERSERRYDVLDDRIVISASAVTAEDQGQADLATWNRSDTITARLSLDRAELAPERDARTLVRVAGAFWNDRADGGLDGPAGDVFVQLRLRAFGDGTREASICVDRDLEDGSEEVPLFDGDHCDTVPDFEPELGTPYTLTIAVDREAGTLTYAVDDRTRTVSVGEAMFVPFNDSRAVQVTQEGPPGESVGSVHAIGTDAFFQDFATEPPVLGPYRPLFDLQPLGRSLLVEEGRARLEVSAPDGSTERLSVPTTSESDRIEAELELSSASALVPAGGGASAPLAQISLGGTFYNDTMAGGFNENEGNVFASISLTADTNRTPTLRYCLFRSNTADFSDATPLLGDADDDCRDTGVAGAFDTPYRVVLELDRPAALMRFTVNGTVLTYAIPTPIHAPEPDRRFLRVQVRAEDGATAVGFVDNYGTSASAPPVAARQDRGEGHDAPGTTETSGDRILSSDGPPISRLGNDHRQPTDGERR